MKHDLYVRRRSRRTDLRPALMWLTLTLLLLGCAGVAYGLVSVTMGEWLELKMDSARYRVLELLPGPERPDFVPTPILKPVSAGIPTGAWSSKIAKREPAATAEPPIPPTVMPVVPAAPETAQAQAQAATPEPTVAATLAPIVVENAALNPIQPTLQLTGVAHEAQRFNNCGPTTLRMFLSYYEYTQDTQVEIANVLKPNKDDRNVGPDELTGYAQQVGFRSITRVNGDLDRIKLLLSNNLPVMVETGYDPPRAKQGWMGHYRLITGYDERGITAQDSYNGPNQFVSWDELDQLWRQFNRTYILVYTAQQEPVVRAILGSDSDDATMYANAAQRAQDEWNVNPQDAFAAFNLGSSLVGLREYESAAYAFDQARVLQLPWRMMWYQFGPYEAYYHVGRFQEIIALADATLEPTNDLEESFYYKGLALQQLGRADQARIAFQSAVRLNTNYHAAQQALAELGS